MLEFWFDLLACRRNLSLKKSKLRIIRKFGQDNVVIVNYSMVMLNIMRFWCMASASRLNKKAFRFVAL